MATESHNTQIQWTHAEGYTGETWNPIIAIHKETGKRGWHCEHASRGCDHCYAESQNKTGLRMGTKEAFTRAARDRVDVQIHEPTLLKPIHWKSPRAIFVCSMTDLFGEWVPDEWIDQIFAVMALTPQHRYYVLTKRAERMAQYLATSREDIWFEHAKEMLWLKSGPALINRKEAWKDALSKNPDVNWEVLQNLWLGVTTEDQKAADERIPHLLNCPAAVRFLSYEPGIGPLDMTALPIDGWNGYSREMAEIRCRLWAIVGGESGNGARPFDINWARRVLRQCEAAGVPVFVKQLGAKPFDSHTGQQLKGLGSHGAAFDLWPDDLKVRQFPEVRP